MLQLPFVIECAPPFLVVSFPEQQRMLSWTVTRPGICSAQQVAWLEVRDRDLPADVDADALIASKASARGLDGIPLLVTSRDIRRHHVAQATVEDIMATCVATVGLSNGERVGRRASTPVSVAGTINLLIHVSQPMTEGAFLETLSIAAQARTVAVIEADVERDGALITGTGTDCIVVAAPCGEPSARYAGLHTAIGEAVGKSTCEAMLAGIECWKEDLRRSGSSE
jgi:adenosylcobinamide amidohydrolase